MPRSTRFLMLFVLVALAGAAEARWPEWTPRPTLSEAEMAEKVERLGLDFDYHECTDVADGDTITLAKLGKVRFVGVDTPEKGHPTLPIQFMALEASRFMRETALGNRVRLEYDSQDDDLRGNYGRLLAYLYLEDGTFLQEELLRRGYAIAYTKYPLDAERKEQFLAWEAEAREKGLGIWADGGMAEVRWLYETGTPRIYVSGGPETGWNLEAQGWSKENAAGPGGLEGAVRELYTAIFAYSPRDFAEEMAKAGYREAPLPEAGKKLALIGMAHKKWGVEAGDLIYPRVEPNELDEHMDWLAARRQALEGEALETALRACGYRDQPAQKD